MSHWLHDVVAEDGTLLCLWAKIDTPKWEEEYGVNDWRYYVPKVLWQDWEKGLALSSKLIIYLLATHQAEEHEKDRGGWLESWD